MKKHFKTFGIFIMPFILLLSGCTPTYYPPLPNYGSTTPYNKSGPGSVANGVGGIYYAEPQQTLDSIMHCIVVELVPENQINLTSPYEIMGYVTNLCNIDISVKECEATGFGGFTCGLKNRLRVGETTDIIAKDATQDTSIAACIYPHVAYGHPENIVAFPAKPRTPFWCR